jgi:hypothetical protein
MRNAEQEIATFYSDELNERNRLNQLSERQHSSTAKQQHWGM